MESTTATWKDDFHTAVGNRSADAMRRAVASGLPIQAYVLGPQDEYTALLYAVDAGAGPGVIQVLIDAGADVNAVVLDSYRATALGLAARRGDRPVVRLLLAAGADVNYSNEADVTPLSFAAAAKKPAHEAVVEALLAAGARPNYQALVGAARSGSPATIERLVRAGAEVNEISRWGTALILAVHEKRADTTEALLRLGADPRLRMPGTHGSYPGETAFDVAPRIKARKILPLLEAALYGHSPPAALPGVPDSVPGLWGRIERGLQGNPAVWRSLRKGAAADQIAACERVLGLTLPPELRASCQIHDGQSAAADGLFPEGLAELDAEFSLLPLAEVASQWKMWRQLADAGEFRGREAQPDTGVRADWWNEKWVPVAWDGGGDSLCIDLDPAGDGTAGQVILHQHADAARTRIAGSFQELLRLLAEHLEETAAA